MRVQYLLNSDSLDWEKRRMTSSGSRTMSEAMYIDSRRHSVERGTGMCGGILDAERRVGVKVGQCRILVTGSTMVV